IASWPPSSRCGRRRRHSPPGCGRHRSERYQDGSRSRSLHRTGVMLMHHGLTRRGFLSTTGKGLVTASVAGAAPMIVPARVLGATAPSNRINIGAIGVGRISREHDMPETLVFDTARIVAVCDLDRKRLEDGRRFVNDFYAKQTGHAYD